MKDKNLNKVSGNMFSTLPDTSFLQHEVFIRRLKRKYPHEKMAIKRDRENELKNIPINLKKPRSYMLK